MNIPKYTPEEMVRLELLAYNNPEGLHPVEENWRNLCRKLMQHTIHVEEKYKTILPRVAYKSEEEKNWKPFKFPQPFKSPDFIE